MRVYGVKVEDANCDTAGGYNYLDYDDWACVSETQAEEMMAEMIEQGCEADELSICWHEANEDEWERVQNINNNRPMEMQA